MTDSDGLLHEANRRAHRTMRVLETFIERSEAYAFHDNDLFFGAVGTEYEALKASYESYKEIEGRQMTEATR